VTKIVTEVELVNGDLVLREFNTREVQMAHLTSLFVLDPNARLTEDLFNHFNETRSIKITITKKIDLR
jgi:hypothetical protein